MTRTRRIRGVTIVEAMVSLAILTIGATGMMGLHRQGQVYLGDSLRLAHATTIGQDLISQIETWSFDDPRLANRRTDNDADLGDSAWEFATSATPRIEFSDADLNLNGQEWHGIGHDAVVHLGMERYWAVAYPDDQNANGVPDAVRVAVIVRWPQGSGWRRVVFMTVKPNPGDFQ